MAYRLRGDLDLVALDRAVVAVSACHDALRARVVEIDDTPVQVVLDEPTRLEVSSVDPLSWRQELARTAQRPFDLRAEPPFRAIAWRVGPDDHVVALTFHHMFIDAVSVRRICDDLRAAYRLARAGEEPRVTSAVPSYRDAIALMSSAPWRDRVDAHLAWWREHIGEAPPPLRLPADEQPSTGAALPDCGGLYEFELDQGLTRRVLRLARATGTTPFSVLLAAYTVLLARYAGERHLAVGIPASGRTATGLEAAVGCFVNLLPMTTAVDPGSTVADHVAATGREVLEILDHQDAPFDEIVQAVVPERDSARHPLVQASFLVLDDAWMSLDLEGVMSEPLHDASPSSRFELELQAHVDERRIGFRLTYDSTRFSPRRVAELSDGYARVLTAFVADRQARVRDISLAAVPGWGRGTGRAEESGAEGACVHHLVETWAARRPDALALDGTSALTYAELDHAANAIAHQLVDAGVAAEDVVGVVADRTAATIVAALGVLKAGAAYLPLDPDLPALRVVQMLDDARADVVVRSTTGDGSAASLRGRRVLDVDVRRTLTDPPAVTVRRDNLCYVTFTSGSTGRAKGVMATHRAVANLVVDPEFARLDPTTKLLHGAPFAFDASTFEVWGALLNGGTCILGEVDDSGLPGGSDATRPDVAWLTSGLFNALVDADPRHLAGLRQLIVGGELVSSRHVATALDANPGLVITNGYGPTECTTFSATCRVVRGDVEDVVPIGRPVRGVELLVVDDELHPLPAGAVGELVISGVGLARGYVGRPAWTADRFVPDPFGCGGSRLYRSGDLCRQRSDGAIEFVGRRDDQVKVRGFRVELAEIEAVFREHSSVMDVVVVIDETASGKRLVAFVSLTVGSTSSMAEMVASFVNSRLPAYMRPAVVEPVERMPLTRNGKVDRRALLQSLPAAPARSKRPARTRAEAVLVSVWRELFGVDVGIDDNFFDLGGDSISAIRVRSSARARGIEFPLGLLFQAETLAELAAAAEEATTGERTEAPETTTSAGTALDLAPAQRWWLGTRPAVPAHFNQTFVFLVQPRAEPATVAAALGAVLGRHGLDGVGFDTDAMTAHTVPSAEPPLEVVDLRGVPDAERRATIERRVAAVQGRLDLSSGLLVRGIWFDQGDGAAAYLAVAVHHMIIDLISWDTLVEDLETAIGHLEDDDEADRMPMRTSFAAWARRVAAQRPDRPDDATYAAMAAASRLATERLGDPAPARSTVSLTREIHADATHELLTTGRRRLGAGLRELVVGLVARAIVDLMPGPAVMIDVEHHGRDLLDDVDVSRSIGWFTAITPILIPRPADDGAVAWIEAARASLTSQDLRQRLSSGLVRGAEATGAPPLPSAPLSLNYVGRQDRPRPGRRLSVVDLAVGPERAGTAARLHPIEVTAVLGWGAVLAITWSFSPVQLDTTTVGAWADQVVDGLYELSGCGSGVDR